MARPSNPTRDKEIALKIQDGWSFRKIARHYGLAVSSTYKAFDRGVKLLDVPLSTSR